jgi:hypothetical protein
MRKIYLFAILLGFAGFLQAQSFTVSPSNTVDTTLDSRTSVDVYINFNNAFQQPITLGWEETNRSYPQGWLMTVCDNNLCYTIPHAADTMAEVAQGGYGFLKLTCTPLEIAGTGTVSYHVYDISNPIYSANVTFNFNVISTSVTVDQASALFSVTPVPAHDVLNLSARNGLLDNGNVQIYDLSGQLMLNENVNAVQRKELDVQSFAPGMYLVRYESKAGVLNQKVLVTH